LPVVAEPSPYRIELTIRERTADPKEFEKSEVPVVPALPDKTISHPIVVRLERLFKNAKKDEKALLIPRNSVAPHLMLSERTLPRALQILDALFVSLEQHSIQVVWPRATARIWSLSTYEASTNLSSLQ
jgi:hypothetical protein